MKLDRKMVCKIGLLGGLEGVDDHLIDILDEIPYIKPGDVIEVYPGLTIRVHESYVDPRDHEDAQLKRVYKRWRVSYPTFEDFKKVVT
jgi:hypothetical protein